MNLLNAFTTNTANSTLYATELFDSTAFRYLKSLQELGDDDKRKLTKFAYRMKNGKKDVIYETYKGYGDKSIGRYTVKNEAGLQAFSRDVRNLLAKKYYWDIDFTNCHPTILVQLCRQQGWRCSLLEDYIQNREERLQQIGNELGIQDRDKQKEIFISLLFGSVSYKDKSKYLKDFTEETKQIEKNICACQPELYKWVKAKKNIVKDYSSPESATVAVFLQTIERTLLITAKSFLEVSGRQMDVLMHDGGFIRKLKGEQEPPFELLKQVEKHILNHTGYSVSVVHKPMKTCYEVPEEEFIYPIDIVINDSFAAKKFAELAGDRLCKSNDKLCCFDESTGLWTSENRALRDLIHIFEKDLIFKQQTATGIATKDYGGCERNIPNLLSQTFNYVKEKEFDYDTAIGKLLFSDGIYDFDSNTFTPGFDPNIHFAGRIERPFPKQRFPETEALVDKILFKDPYLDEQKEQADFFKTAIARGIYGDYRAKRAYLSVGEPNCGRGLLTEALKLAFGTFVATFSSNHLLYNARSSDDFAKQLAWFLPLCNTRLSIANEISMNGKFVDSNILKSISSGGDTLDARLLNHNIQQVVSRTTLFMLTNDVPQMKPADKGLQNRLCVNELKKSYMLTPDPNNKYQAQEDRSLKDKFKATEWLDSLFWILADTWSEFAKTDRKAPKPAAVEMAIAEWIETGTSIKSLLEEKFEITKNEDDFVSFKLILKHLKEKGCADSDTKIGREIKKLTCYDSVMKKIGGVSIRVRPGMKKIEEELE